MLNGGRETRETRKRRKGGDEEWNEIVRRELKGWGQRVKLDGAVDQILRNNERNGSWKRKRREVNE